MILTAFSGKKKHLFISVLGFIYLGEGILYICCFGQEDYSSLEAAVKEILPFCLYRRHISLTNCTVFIDFFGGAEY